MSTRDTVTAAIWLCAIGVIGASIVRGLQWVGCPTFAATWAVCVAVHWRAIVKGYKTGYAVGRMSWLAEAIAGLGKDGK